MIRATPRVDDVATSRLREIAAQLGNPVALYKDARRRLANDLRKHFAQLDASQTNRLGGKRTHFWLDVRPATLNPEFDASGQGVSVTIAHLAFAQKLYGGTIVAKNAKALTIPLHPLAHGRRASVFEEETGHKLFRGKSKKPNIARLLFAEIDGNLIPIYALATTLTEDADPRAPPPIADLRAGAVESAEKHLARLLARG